MRRPKAAIPILPPPENQHQSSRGRGRITQQQQASLAGGTLHTDMEVKANLLEGDEKPVPGQFDNTQDEQIGQLEETEEIDEPSVVTDIVVDDEKHVKNIEIDAPLDSQVVGTEQTEEISANDTSKLAIDDEIIIPLKSPHTLVEKTEIDLEKIEIAAAESTVVEEAAA